MAIGKTSKDINWIHVNNLSIQGLTPKKISIRLGVSKAIIVRGMKTRGITINKPKHFGYEETRKKILKSNVGQKRTFRISHEPIFDPKLRKAQTEENGGYYIKKH